RHEPAAARTALELGWALLLRDEASDAACYLEHAARCMPWDPDVLQRVGLGLAQRDPDAGRDYLLRSLAVAPDRMELVLRLLPPTIDGRMLLERLLANEAAEGWMWLEIAAAMRRSGHGDLALAAADKALERDGRLALAVGFERILSLCEQGAYKMALAESLVMEGRFPEEKAGYEGGGLALAGLGRLEEGLERLLHATRLASRDPWVWVHLGDLYLEMDRPYPAMDAYSKAVELHVEPDVVKDRLRKAAVRVSEAMRESGS
ncbi:hypothetical protein JW905_00155, partial [bacterium]|nr:hypothetical protein [candidate division CSSED10-310 bacterium]